MDISNFSMSASEKGKRVCLKLCERVGERGGRVDNLAPSEVVEIFVEACPAI